eukprot:TRINITY_DN950_c0_g1_i1.p1 TRINITY_DN950_c0_g1~~TRINITY_DN950_c0_g1_i1.p1  ORF type:complete len:1185 (-),score=307.11 TRINITY_DN950_c0_g1_i1:1822-5241(-)
MACFDLSTVVAINERAKKWQCPTCSANRSWESVIIDPYFNVLAAALQREFDEEVTDVEVKADGSWRPKREGRRSSAELVWREAPGRAKPLIKDEGLGWAVGAAEPALAVAVGSPDAGLGTAESRLWGGEHDQVKMEQEELKALTPFRLKRSRDGSWAINGTDAGGNATATQANGVGSSHRSHHAGGFQQSSERAAGREAQQSAERGGGLLLPLALSASSRPHVHSTTASDPNRNAGTPRSLPGTLETTNLWGSQSDLAGMSSSPQAGTGLSLSPSPASSFPSFLSQAALPKAPLPLRGAGVLSENLTQTGQDISFLFPPASAGGRRASSPTVTARTGASPDGPSGGAQRPIDLSDSDSEPDPGPVPHAGTSRGSAPQGGMQLDWEEAERDFSAMQRGSVAAVPRVSSRENIGAPLWARGGATQGAASSRQHMLGNSLGQSLGQQARLPESRNGRQISQQAEREELLFDARSPPHLFGAPLPLWLPEGAENGLENVVTRNVSDGNLSLVGSGITYPANGTPDAAGAASGYAQTLLSSALESRSAASGRHQGGNGSQPYTWQQHQQQQQVQLQQVSHEHDGGRWSSTPSLSSSTSFPEEVQVQQQEQPQQQQEEQQQQQQQDQHGEIEDDSNSALELPLNAADARLLDANGYHLTPDMLEDELDLSSSPPDAAADVGLGAGSDNVTDRTHSTPLASQRVSELDLLQEAENLLTESMATGPHAAGAGGHLPGAGASTGHSGSYWLDLSMGGLANGSDNINNDDWPGQQSSQQAQQPSGASASHSSLAQLEEKSGLSSLSAFPQQQQQQHGIGLHWGYQQQQQQQQQQPQQQQDHQAAGACLFQQQSHQWQQTNLAPFQQQHFFLSQQQQQQQQQQDCHQQQQQASAPMFVQFLPTTAPAFHAEQGQGGMWPSLQPSSMGHLPDAGLPTHVQPQALPIAQAHPHKQAQSHAQALAIASPEQLHQRWNGVAQQQQQQGQQNQYDFYSQLADASPDVDESELLTVAATWQQEQQPDGVEQQQWQEKGQFGVSPHGEQGLSATSHGAAHVPVTHAFSVLPGPDQPAGATDADGTAATSAAVQSYSSAAYETAEDYAPGDAASAEAYANGGEGYPNGYLGGYLEQDASAWPHAPPENGTDEDWPADD